MSTATARVSSAGYYMHEPPGILAMAGFLCVRAADDSGGSALPTKQWGWPFSPATAVRLCASSAVTNGLRATPARIVRPGWEGGECSRA